MAPLARALIPIVLAAALPGCTEPNPAFRLRPPARDGADSRPDAGLDADPLSDGPTAADTAPPADVPSGDAPPSTDAARACGSARPDISAIVGADGLAVGDDGTLYFTSDDGTHGWIGRVLPGQAPEAQWLRLDYAPLTAGLAYDRARDRLYVASVSGKAILKFEPATGTPAGTVVVDKVEGVNDLALDPGGNLYYTVQKDRHIHRVDPQGNTTIVTLTPLGDTAANQSPAALAFAPDGTLLVGLKNGGPLYRLRLDGGTEQARSRFSAFDGWANGLAFDAAGRLYVGLYADSDDAHLLRLDADGSNPVEPFGDGVYASLVFGRGPLDCHDLYAANPRGPLRRLTTDTPGLLP